MPTLLETFASYAPALLIRHLATRATSLNEPARYPVQAALLFADISGFTALTERLAGHGPAGVEELSRLLNVFFGQILDQIETHGGDVVKFAGDALLAVWVADDEDLPTATHRAAECALALHRRMHNFYRLIDTVPLVLRIGIAAGDMAVLHVGGVYGRWEWLMTGAALSQVGLAEHQAQPGEVVLDPHAWSLIAPATTATALPGGGMRLDQIAPCPQPRPVAPPALPPDLDSLLRAYIPGAVLSRLIAGQTSWLAELRRVTVIFVNLPAISHATPLDLVQSVMRTLQTTLYRYEGSVNKISLDDKGVTLVAGMGLPPLSHENDAVRGVQAALAMQQALHEMGLPCNIGVASGRAFCGEIGTAERREYTMIGNIVNLAARLMQAAANCHQAEEHADATVIPLLCDETTFLAARSRLAFAPLPPLMVKGIARPVLAYRPLGTAAADAIEGPQSTTARALVGRQREQEIIAEQIQTMMRRMQGGVVLIEGEAGMGKSRLVEALHAYAADLRLMVLRGTSDPAEQSTPYYAWRGVFSQLFDISILRAIEDRRQHMLNLLEDEAELLPRLPLLNAVLPLDFPENEVIAHMSAQLRADTTRDLLLRLLQRSAQRSPKLLILEDAHWFDSASWSLALAVAQRVRPLLLLITLRPLTNRDTQSSQSVTAPAEYVQLLAQAQALLRLKALTPEETHTLVCQRLGVTSLPDVVAELIWSKAQGNPFYSEELAFALRDAGLIQINGTNCEIVPNANLDSLAFPETVQGTIISRIDRLTPTQQLTLKVASVIGRSFTVRTLQAIYPVTTTNAHLASDLALLTRLGIIARDTPEPDLGYSFKHAITQDVVYNLMLFAQRRQLHRAVAAWYEQTYADDLTWLFPLLAHHWGKAGELGKAIDYLEKAGQRALSISALNEARLFFVQALDLLAEAPGDAHEAQHQRMILTRLMGDAVRQLGDFATARSVLNQSLNLARALDDHHGIIDALGLLGLVAIDTGAYGAAQHYLNESLALARADGDPPRIARALSNLGNVAMRQELYAECERYYQESLSLFAAMGDRVGVALVLNGLGNSAVDQRLYDVARYCYAESLATRQAIGDRWSSAGCLNNLGWIAHLLGDYDQARQHYEESLAISRAIGDRRGMVITLNNLGFTAFALGDQQRAAQFFTEALPIGMEIGATPLILELLIGFARLRAHTGQPEQAAEWLGLAQHHPASNNDVRIQIELFRNDLERLLSPDRLAAAIERGRNLPLDAVLTGLNRELQATHG